MRWWWWWGRHYQDTGNVRVQTLALIMRDNTGPSGIFMRMRRAPVWNSGACRWTLRWVDRASVEIWERCPSSRCKREKGEWTGSPTASPCLLAPWCPHSLHGIHSAPLVTAAPKRPKLSFFFPLFSLLEAAWPKQWGAHQETSSGCCLRRGAEIGSKWAEGNGGVRVVHQPAERRDELHQRRESFKDVCLFYRYSFCSMLDGRVGSIALTWMW